MGHTSRQRVIRILCLLLFIGSICLTTIGYPLPSNAKIPPALTPQEQLKNGMVAYQSGNYPLAIQNWQQALETYQRLKRYSTAMMIQENLARAYQQVGQYDAALASWKQTLQLYTQVNEEPPQPPEVKQKRGRLLTEQAQTHTKIGQYRQAISLLCGAENHLTCLAESAMGIAQSEGDQSGEIAALGSLGMAYYQQGTYDKAMTYLETGLVLSEERRIHQYQAALLNSLGNTHSSLAQKHYRQAQSVQKLGYNNQSQALAQKGKVEDETALQYFQDSVAIAGSPEQQLQPLLNSISSYYRTDQLNAGETARQQARQLLTELPDSRSQVFASIKLTHLWTPAEQPDQQFSQAICPITSTQDDIKSLLTDAIAISQRIGDRRAESFALGTMGHLYECQQNFPQALKLTEQARWAAEDLNSADSLYLWDWQAGRILHAQGQDAAAVDAYEQAISTLQSIRSDIVIADRDLQFDFRDTIEPIFRELAQMRLIQAQVKPETAQQNFAKTLRTVDELKLAELQNYFGDDCQITALPDVDVETISQDQKTAVLSTLMLGDRSAVILTLPNQTRQIHWIDQSDSELRQFVNTYRRGLETFYQPYDQRPAQALYRELIRPFETALADQQIQTLVFVQDGIFRSAPMAALHDGTQYLIQKYAIATTPFFQLNTANQLEREKLSALIFGLTEPAVVQDRQYQPLTYIKQEVESIASLLPRTRPFLDQWFTRDRMQQELEKTIDPIVHIATHAEFGPNPEDTYLVTGNNEVLSINEFDALLRSVPNANASLELLALTACRTAVGDDRAALGLAGVSLQAGAKSTLASLWYINDGATAEFVKYFYQALLQSDLSKAEALQQAQRSLLESSQTTAHPAYWAPFILIGNWI